MYSLVLLCNIAKIGLSGKRCIPHHGIVHSMEHYAVCEDVASIGCDTTAVRYAVCGYCRGEEGEKKVTLLAR